MSEEWNPPYQASRAALTATQFIDTFYKPSRMREPGKRERLIESAQLDLALDGYTLISHHASVTGEVEWLGELPGWPQRGPASVRKWAQS